MKTKFFNPAAADLPSPEEQFILALTTEKQALNARLQPPPTSPCFTTDTTY